MIKQVIVVRTDLNMPIGRIPAQVAHASLAVILNMGKFEYSDFCIKDIPSDIYYWMKESFTKIVLKVHSEDQLLDIRDEVKDANIPCALISDDIFGKVEYTALGIGPYDASEIDEITGNLLLY